MAQIKIGLVGDFDEKMYTHMALNDAIEHCRPHFSFSLHTPWLSTDKLDKSAFKEFDAFWITPGSPYKNDQAVYDLITHCRLNNIPLFGTCGGFQYMVVEYARNVLGIDAGHQESDHDTELFIITKMTCSLKGQQEEVYITDKGSWLYQTLKQEKIIGKFNCSYGVNQAFQKKLNQFPFVFTAFSNNGEARALEVKDHRFFNGVLFQPPLSSSKEKPNELLLDFFRKIL